MYAVFCISNCWYLAALIFYFCVFTFGAAFLFVVIVQWQFCIMNSKLWLSSADWSTTKHQHQSHKKFYKQQRKKSKHMPLNRKKRLKLFEIVQRLNNNRNIILLDVVCFFNFCPFLASSWLNTKKQTCPT